MNDNQIINIVAALCDHEAQLWNIGDKLSSNYGFKNLGKGASCYAFEHPANNNKVVRISGAALSDAWLSFSLYVRENPSPIFPVIYAQRVVSTNLVITIMERLECDEHNLGICDARRLGGRYSLNTTDSMLKYVFQEHWFDVRKLITTLGDWDDLHGGNIMYRNGRPVLSDPYYDIKELHKYKVHKNQISPSVNLEVITHAERLQDAALLAQLREVPTVRLKAEDQVLRRESELACKPRPERVQGALLPWEPRLRGLRPAWHIDFAGIERQALADIAAIARMQPVVRQWFDPARDQVVIERSYVEQRVNAADFILDMAQPVRYIPEGGEPVFHVRRPEGRTVSIPGVRKKRWEAAVPCQKAVAEERRRRAEVHRKLSRNAA